MSKDTELHAIECRCIKCVPRDVMTAKILQFPDRRGDHMTSAERISLLIDAHTALVEAITEHQTKDGDVPAVFSLDEALELCEVLEKLIGPGGFDDEIA